MSSGTTAVFALLVTVGAPMGYDMGGPRLPSTHMAFSDPTIANPQSKIENPSQVSEKWLKDCKGLTLDYADIQHYAKSPRTRHVPRISGCRSKRGDVAAVRKTFTRNMAWPRTKLLH